MDGKEEPVPQVNRVAADDPAEPLDLAEFAVVPEEGDNCAILRRGLEAGTRVKLFDGTVVTMGTTVLEGHRIAVVPLEKDQHILSWNLPFGYALEDIAPGTYLCNSIVLAALRLRKIEGLPDEPNFMDLILPHVLDEEKFAPAEQIPMLPPDQCLTFMGFDRSDSQGGVGTRNFVTVVPTSALSSSFSRRLSDALRSDAKALPNCDGVVALAHTEAALDAGSPRPKNWDLLLRTLSGFVSHPNAAAVLVVGYNSELLSPEVLRSHMESIGRPLPRWCRFLTLSGEFEADLAEGKETLQAWLPQVNQCARTEQPLKYLSLALQCGGSDAFSGVSGNPSAGVAAKLLIENGGNAVLAETDELMGAESYILSRVGNIETARKFLHFVDRFKERFNWHGGQSAESNPSDGNKLRGLYNIALKSLGAAKKKHADVSLDGVIDYGERIPLGQRGYYFLDSPGNDLESIAGQVASGCNAIFFVTGNGSITNFPFVPTIKIITTNDRYRLMERDMDFNAGRFQSGELTMPELGSDLFDMLVRMASGERSLGERAGHSQISIWREWAQVALVSDLESLTIRELAGTPITMQEDDSTEDEVAVVKSSTYASIGGRASERLGLVLPTSLCSGEVSRLLSEQLNANRLKIGEDGSPVPPSIDRFISLPHTEGCGIGYAGDGDRIFSRIMLGHLMHPNVAQALMMEHGCEKTHNSWMLHELNARGIDTSRYGMASLQLDGGIANASEKVHAWFEEQAKSLPESTRADVAIADLPIAVIGEANTGGAAMLAAVLSRSFVGAGGTVVVPGNAAVFRSAAFLDEVCGGNSSVKPSLAFAQSIGKPGMHIMDVPAGVLNRIEVITGLVACGVGAVVVVSNAATAGSAPPVLGSPVVPVLHIVVHDGLEDDLGGRKTGDLQLGRRPNEDDRSCRLRWMQMSVDLLSSAASLKVQPRSTETLAFQIARGPTGVSA